jgi:hypothetical protein
VCYYARYSGFIITLNTSGFLTLDTSRFIKLDTSRFIKLDTVCLLLR